MDQAYIIDEITELFAEKLKEVSSDDIPFDVITSDIEGNEGDRHIRVYLLGIEQTSIFNRQERFLRRGTDESGNEIEYLTDPPSMLRAWYMIVPWSQSMKESYRMLGLIIRHVKDNGFLKVNECDWIGNDGEVVMVEQTEGMNIDKQMQTFQQLNLDFRPALYYNLVVGINSDKKEHVRRVKTLDLRTLNKMEQDRKRNKIGNKDVPDSEEAAKV